MNFSYMTKDTDWNKQKIADFYDFGRPMDENVIIELFEKIHKKNNISFENTLLFDAGCGTGRITLPLARHFPLLKISGLDISSEMLQVLKQKIVDQKIFNYEILQGNLLDIPFNNNYFNFSLVSSVLHGISNWQKAVNEIIKVTKNTGLIFLISEESDLYNIGLGRISGESRNLLEKFWGQYINLRQIHRIENPEDSQVGIKWQLGCPEIIEYLQANNKGKKIDDITITWQKQFFIRDFMDILEKKPWSSMFTANEEKYNLVVSDMISWLKKENINQDEICMSENIFKCEVIELK